MSVAIPNSASVTCRWRKMISSIWRITTEVGFLNGIPQSGRPALRSGWRKPGVWRRHSFQRQLQPGDPGFADDEEGAIVGFEQGRDAAEVVGGLPMRETLPAGSAHEEIAAGAGKDDDTGLQFDPGHDQDCSRHVAFGPSGAIVVRHQHVATEPVGEQGTFPERQYPEERALIRDVIFVPGLPSVGRREKGAGFPGEVELIGCRGSDLVDVQLVGYRGGVLPVLSAVRGQQAFAVGTDHKSVQGVAEENIEEDHVDTRAGELVFPGFPGIGRDKQRPVVADGPAAQSVAERYARQHSARGHDYLAPGTALVVGKQHMAAVADGYESGSHAGDVEEQRFRRERCEFGRFGRAEDGYQTQSNDAQHQAADAGYLGPALAGEGSSTGNAGNHWPGFFRGRGLRQDKVWREGEREEAPPRSFWPVGSWASAHKKSGGALSAGLRP